MIIQSTKQGNSIFDEMKSRVFDLYMMERQNAYEVYTNDNEVSQALKISDAEYSFNLSKLDVLATLAKRAEFIQKSFIQQKIYIDQMDISEKNKVMAILTAACIFEYFGIELTNRNVQEEEFFLLSQAMINVEPNNYLVYQPLVLNNFDKLVKMLRNISGLTENHIKQNKQYVKTENN